VCCPGSRYASKSVQGTSRKAPSASRGATQRYGTKGSRTVAILLLYLAGVHFPSP